MHKLYHLFLYNDGAMPLIEKKEIALINQDDKTNNKNKRKVKKRKNKIGDKMN